jgi:hypothetical protein
MDEITVKKADLLAIMRTNREAHHAIVVEAQRGFRAKVIDRLDEMLRVASKGEKIDLHIGLVMPEDHTNDYDTVIGMLELEVDDEVVLTTYEYRQWVQDNWGWTQTFYGSNSTYSLMAAQHVD